ncbi:uncharacterized protein HKW66_Vig0177540 [Vigna angularis]|uniref:Uncharacterized protein n=1 Tax=Phaseolus angularis TaxID=3914 RepID=A0A8T0JXS1_PHAAN|nr:uncharacterized protein HKW66_Vig0177540 [Vigna angularis]
MKDGVAKIKFLKITMHPWFALDSVTIALATVLFLVLTTGAGDDPPTTTTRRKLKQKEGHRRDEGKKLRIEANSEEGNNNFFKDAIIEKLREPSRRWSFNYFGSRRKSKFTSGTHMKTITVAAWFCLHKYQNPTLCTSPDEFAAIVQCPGDRPNFDGEVCLCPHPPMMKESMLKKVVVCRRADTIQLSQLAVTNRSNLDGLNLYKFLDGSHLAPTAFIDNTDTPPVS